jgi:hypothetical protein
MNGVTLGWCTKCFKQKLDVTGADRCRKCAVSEPALGKLTSKIKLPIWIDLVTESPFGPPSRHGRLDGDSLVGDPESKFYNTSVSLTPISTVFSLEGQYILPAYCMRIAMISKISSCVVMAS